MFMDYLLIGILHNFGQQFGSGGGFNQLVPVVLPAVPCAALRALHSSTTLRTVAPGDTAESTKHTLVSICAKRNEAGGGRNAAALNPSKEHMLELNGKACKDPRTALY